ncbi:hypothetical protein JD844_001640 [Phrynosoma platyrhinos]|uniref:Phosphatidylinositol transfer protein N-terminal domain-containing protein n=1 Tax=Phrynosoma platyrhinos TaxID=52577 RepID=A0ABQ7TAE9_PHRPL|nr:hypothetical protein JD844_001640 [Phrynosoma platyrhinos]
MPEAKRVAIAVWLLAHQGSYSTAATHFGVGKSTACKAFIQVVIAMELVLPRETGDHRKMNPDQILDPSSSLSLWNCWLVTYLEGEKQYLPISFWLSQYQVGQLFSVAEASKNNTGGGEGIEVLKNEPYEREGERGQFTHKIYHLQSKVPGFLKMFAPEGSLVVHERAWNAYPYCRTVFPLIAQNEYMKEDFFIKIETWHKPDLGDQENVHGLDAETWKDVDVVHIDIGDRTQVTDDDYKPDEDPALFKSQKTGRGPLGPDWKRELANNEDCPHMCAYKLVTVKFRWWGFQGRVEKFIQKQERRLFTNFHRQLFCWLDKWVDLSMADIRQMEEETQKELDELV